MSYTASFSVIEGNPTKASDLNTVSESVEFDHDLSDVDHDFDPSTGDGHHKDTVHFATGTAYGTVALKWWTDADGGLWLLGKTADENEFTRNEAQFYLEVKEASPNTPPAS